MKRTILALTIAGITLGIGTQAHGYVLTMGGTETTNEGRDTSVANATKNSSTRARFQPGIPAGPLQSSIQPVLALPLPAIRAGIGPLVPVIMTTWARLFLAPLSYFGFDWSTPDSYNFLRLYRDDTLLAEFTGDSINKIAGYVNINAVGADPYFNKIQFSSPGFNAFETDNHAWVIGTVVPEPSSFAMMIAGLAVLAGVARRRLSAQ